MVSKCGPERVDHWAHRGKRNCDVWWEPETPWHRRWKSRFPEEWREVIATDAVGERHIADVQSNHGLTLEFQHSHLKPEERAARETFYSKLLWVVDGLRLTRDLPRLVSGFDQLRRIGNGVYLTPFAGEIFPKNWLNCRAPVIFDFESDKTDDGSVHIGDLLWCLLPGRAENHSVIIAMQREDLVRAVHASDQPIKFQAIMKSVRDLLSEQQRTAHAAAQQAYLLSRQPWRRRASRRRTPRF